MQHVCTSPVVRNACLERSKRFVRCPKKEIGRAYMQISRVVVERVTPDDLVNRFCSKLGLTCQVRREVAELTVKNAETGRRPSSVVAAAIYLTSGKSQREIKEVTGVSEVTIRHAVKLLCNRK